MPTGVLINSAPLSYFASTEIGTITNQYVLDVLWFCLSQALTTSVASVKTWKRSTLRSPLLVSRHCSVRLPTADWQILNLTHTSFHFRSRPNHHPVHWNEIYGHCIPIHCLHHCCNPASLSTDFPAATDNGSRGQVASVLALHGTTRRPRDYQSFWVSRAMSCNQRCETRLLPGTVLPPLLRAKMANPCPESGCGCHGHPHDGDFYQIARNSRRGRHWSGVCQFDDIQPKHPGVTYMVDYDGSIYRGCSACASL